MVNAIPWDECRALTDATKQAILARLPLRYDYGEYERWIEISDRTGLVVRSWDDLSEHDGRQLLAQLKG